MYHPIWYNVPHHQVEQIASTEQGNLDYIIYTGDAPAHDVWLQVVCHLYHCFVDFFLIQNNAKKKFQHSAK